MNVSRQPRDPAAYKRDRRQAVLRHHPDTGGDPEELARALDEVDRKHGLRSSRAPENAATAEQVAAIAMATFAGIAAVGLSIAMSAFGKRK